MSRRTTLQGLAAGAVLIGLTACDTGRDASTAPPAADASPSSTSSTSPDQELVRHALAAIGDAAAEVGLVARRRHRLSALLAPLTTLHLAQRKALDATDAPPGRAPDPTVPRSRARALSDVVKLEGRLVDQLGALGARCASGELARLLASMSAGVLQQVATLRRVDPDALPQPRLDGPADRTTEEAAALQRTLAAEHAAVYVYGVLGAQTSQSDEQSAPLFAALSAGYAAHLARRDVLIASLVAAGATPTPSAVAYDVPQRLGRVEVVERTARGLEAGCARDYAYLVAQTTGATRRWAIAVLGNAAVRELAFRGTPETFPGASELADR